MSILNKSGTLFVGLLLLFSFVSLGEAVCGSCPSTLTGAPPNGQVLTVQCNNIPAEPVVTYPDGGCSSGSILVVLQETRTLGSCPSQYTINRQWRTFTANACGQTITSSQTIIVQDSTQPTVNKPSDITITCDQLTDPSVTGQATGDDNCVATLFTLNFNPGDPSNCDRNCLRQGNLVFVSPVDSSYTLTLMDDRSNGGFGGLANGVHITNENYGNQKVGSSIDHVLGAYNDYFSPGMNYHSSGVVGILNKPAKRVRIDDTDDDSTTKTLWALNSVGTIKSQDGPGSRRTFSAQSSVVDVVRFEFDTVLGTGGGSTDGTYFTVDNLVVEGALITVSSSDTVTSTNWCNRQISRTWISTDACGNVSPGSVQTITIIPPPCGSSYPGLPFSWVSDSGVTQGTACSGASISLTKRFQDTTTCTSGQLVVTVDWAEGNGLVTVPGAGSIDASTATGAINLAHSYNSAGDRTITVCVRVGSGSNYCTSHLIRVNNVARLLAPLEWLMYVPQTITWDQIDSSFNGQQVTVSIKNIGSNASSANLRVLDTVSISAGGIRVKGLSKILPGSYSLFATVQNGCIMTPVDFEITVPGV